MSYKKIVVTQNKGESESKSNIKGAANQGRRVELIIEIKIKKKIDIVNSFARRHPSDERNT